MWQDIYAMPEGAPLRKHAYGAWSLVMSHRNVVGIPEAALLAAADGLWDALDAAHRLGGDCAVFDLLKPYLEKLGVKAQDVGHGDEHVARVGQR